MTNQPKDPGAYKCPSCGMGTWVTDSRPSGEGIRRRRKCFGEVQHRFTTMEVSMGVFKEIDVEAARIAVVDSLNDFIAKYNALNRSLKHRLRKDVG